MVEVGLGPAVPSSHLFLRPELSLRHLGDSAADDPPFFLGTFHSAPPNTTPTFTLSRLYPNADCLKISLFPVRLDLSRRGRARSMGFLSPPNFQGGLGCPPKGVGFCRAVVPSGYRLPEEFSQGPDLPGCCREMGQAEFLSVTGRGEFPAAMGSGFVLETGSSLLPSCLGRNLTWKLDQLGSTSQQPNLSELYFLVSKLGAVGLSFLWKIKGDICKMTSTGLDTVDAQEIVFPSTSRCLERPVIACNLTLVWFCLCGLEPMGQRPQPRAGPVANTGGQ